MKKVLVLYTSVGLGHMYLALNVTSLLVSEGYEVEARDVLKVEEGVLSRFGQKIYLFIVKKFPWVWDYLYRANWIYKVAKPVSLWLASWHTRNLEELIDLFQPDLIISTQITASSLVSNLKKKNKYKGIFAVAFSDYHFHPFWVVPNADIYFVNIDSQKKELEQACGIGTQVKVVGMSLARDMKDVSLIRQELGFRTDEKIVVLAAGSLGIFSPELLIRELLKIEDLSIVVITGKNLDLEKSLKGEFSEEKSRVKIWGFKKKLLDLYKISSVLITKPGGLTVAEALSEDLPMVITHVLPGQESLNLEYLIQRKLVIDGRGFDLKKIRELVEDEVRFEGFRKQLASNEFKYEVLTRVSEVPKIVTAVNEIMHKV